ncbi:growth arrest-specific protein 1 [Hyla sarda]|uniref:growth arrest-specific protein 1 n=1 Tax=Hyla sarda TaxID=327740 RepID=UPI0024C241D0|nr:growth arrest-specific protein 1 [Hyla sarda]
MNGTAHTSLRGRTTQPSDAICLSGHRRIVCSIVRRGMAAGCGLPYVLLLLPALLGHCSGQRVCWQAMMRCQSEKECRFAYVQYIEACGMVLNGGQVNEPTKRRCPSHCINAIIQLNQTEAGPALEDCDCSDDSVCIATKQAIEPCMPRSAKRGSVIGCTAARRICERDGRCAKSMISYLKHCGQLFNGVNCPIPCKAVISEMMLMPKAMMLNDCVCDGVERPICESVKDSMVRLCFGPDGDLSSSGEADDYTDDEYDDLRPTKATHSGGAQWAASLATLWTCVVLLMPH